MKKFSKIIKLGNHSRLITKITTGKEKGKYRAFIYIEGLQKRIGVYKDKEKAINIIEKSYLNKIKNIKN